MLRKRFVGIQQNLLTLLKRPKTLTVLGIVLLTVIGLFVISQPQITMWTSSIPKVKWMYPPEERTMAPFWIGSANQAELDTTLHEALVPLMILGAVLGPGAWIGGAVVLVLDWLGVLDAIKLTEHELYIFNIPVRVEWLDGDRNIKIIRIDMVGSEQGYEFEFDAPGRPSFTNTYDFVWGVGMEQLVLIGLGLDSWCPDPNNPLKCYEGQFTTITFDLYIEDWEGNSDSLQIKRGLFFSKTNAYWDLHPDMEKEMWMEYAETEAGIDPEPAWRIGIGVLWIILPMTLAGLVFYRKRKYKNLKCEI